MAGTRTLIVITGPTGSGKTDLAIRVARHFGGCHVISADSRQVYRGIPIGTAAPSAEQLSAVRHHFVQTLELDEYYSAAAFESDVLKLLPELWAENPYAVMCGGSMMYVDAVCHGIDELPTISAETRAKATKIYADGGVDGLRRELELLDPEYYAVVDRSNHKRMIHAIEITMQAGVPYSSLRTGRRRKRDFRIVKVAVDYPRPVLFDRINSRVDRMIADGLEKEAAAVYGKRHLNSLNTVGYKELFQVMDGAMDRSTAIERIKKNTRVYAKKQLTWLKRDADVVWIEPSTAFEEIVTAVESM